MSKRLIRLRLNSAMVQLVWTILEELPTQSLALPPDFLPEDDDDLREAWHRSLVEQLEEDYGFLRQTLTRLRANGSTDLDASAADVFLRAITAMRLNLHHHALGGIEKDLLADATDAVTLPEALQPAYACYLLLVDIQGQVIAQIEQHENPPFTS